VVVGFRVLLSGFGCGFGVGGVGIGFPMWVSGFGCGREIFEVFGAAAVGRLVRLDQPHRQPQESVDLHTIIVFKAHTLWYASTLGSKVTKKKVLHTMDQPHRQPQESVDLHTRRIKNNFFAEM